MTPYAEGYNAYYDGDPCPYKVDSDEMDEWVSGFYDAEDDDIAGEDYYDEYYNDDYYDNDYYDLVRSWQSL